MILFVLGGLLGIAVLKISLKFEDLVAKTKDASSE